VKKWNPDSWRAFPVNHIPEYPNQDKLLKAEKTLGAFPPLVFSGEIRQLENLLAQAVAGKAFILQGGDCAESFSQFNADNIRNTFRVILQMSVILTSSINLPVIKIGRMAGQFAKPRSAAMETQGNEVLESYKGDIINGMKFDKSSRIPDPSRMLKAYSQAASTLNLLRAFTEGGYADFKHVHSWNMDFVQSGPQGDRYAHVADRIQKNLNFMEALGITSRTTPQLKNVNFYTSHEALLLPFEQALTREDPQDGNIYNTSAHFVWIGDRTRDIKGGHVEFCRGIKNPLGIKCGPGLKASDLLKLLDILNPENKPGRITLIPRFGYEDVAEHLPGLIKKVQSEGRAVIWSCDPMHGNTIKSSNGLKTRPFDFILNEVRNNILIHQAEGTRLSGIHLEMTGENVTECTGGPEEISENSLSDRYHTHCDPRLNANQAIELAFLIADELTKSRNADQG